jgi:hypothetical protein
MSRWISAISRPGSAAGARGGAFARSGSCGWGTVCGSPGSRASTCSGATSASRCRRSSGSMPSAAQHVDRLRVRPRLQSVAQRQTPRDAKLARRHLLGRGTLGRRSRRSGAWRGGAGGSTRARGGAAVGKGASPNPSSRRGPGVRSGCRAAAGRGSAVRGISGLRAPPIREPGCGDGGPRLPRTPDPELLRARFDGHKAPSLLPAFRTCATGRPAGRRRSGRTSAASRLVRHDDDRRGLQPLAAGCRPPCG